MDDDALIDMVRNHKCIWDGSKGHKEEKDQIWTFIGMELDMPVEECKTYWFSLRSKYTRERRQLKERGANYKEKWINFDKLSFLGDVAKPRRNFKRELRESLQLPDDVDYSSSEFAFDHESSRESIVDSNKRIATMFESAPLKRDFSRSVIHSSVKVNEVPKVGTRDSNEDLSLEELNSLTYISPELMHLTGYKLNLNESSKIQELQQSASFATSSKYMATNLKQNPTSTTDSINNLISKPLSRKVHCQKEKKARIDASLSHEITEEEDSSKNMNQVTDEVSEMLYVDGFGSRESVVISNIRIVSPKKSTIDLGETTFEVPLQRSDFSRPVIHPSVKTNEVPKVGSRDSNEDLSLEELNSLAYISPQLMQLAGYKPNLNESSKIREVQSTSFATSSKHVATNLPKNPMSTTITKPFLRRVYFNKGKETYKDASLSREITEENGVSNNVNEATDEVSDNPDAAKRKPIGEKNPVRKFHLNEVPCASSDKPPRRVRLVSTRTTSTTQKRATKPALTELEWANKVKKAPRDPPLPSRTTVEDALENINRVVDELQGEDEAPDTTFDSLGKYVAGTLNKMSAQESIYLEERILQAIIETRGRFSLGNVDENI